MTSRMMTRGYLTALRGYAEEASNTNGKPARAELAQQISNILKRIDSGHGDDSVEPFARLVCAARNPLLEQYFATCPFEQVREAMVDMYCLFIIGSRSGAPADIVCQSCSTAKAIGSAIVSALRRECMVEELINSRQLLPKLAQPVQTEDAPPKRGFHLKLVVSDRIHA